MSAFSAAVAAVDFDSDADIADADATSVPALTAPAANDTAVELPIHEFVTIHKTRPEVLTMSKVVFYTEDQGNEETGVMILAPGIEYDQQVHLDEHQYSTWSVHGIRVDGREYHKETSAPELQDLMKMSDTALRMMTDYFGLEYFVGPDDQVYEYHGFRVPADVSDGIVFIIEKTNSFGGPVRKYPKGVFTLRVREFLFRVSDENTVFDPEEEVTFEEENEYGVPSTLFDDRALDAYIRIAQENERRSYTNLRANFP
jgi:hypothetical protein